MFLGPNKSLSLKCFSPPVMLATFLIEVAGAMWVLYKYKKERASQIIVALLLCLATFQAAEYVICEGAFGMSGLTWSRIGYVAISFLPPLGLHLGMVLAKKEHKLLRNTAYAAAIAFSTFFLTVGHGITGQVCGGNYVIFTIAPEASVPYGIYYYGWLLIGIYSAWNLSKQVKSKKTRLSLKWLAAGYLVFLVPTTAVNLIRPETTNGIPSIMCGFAVLLALILLFKVAPIALQEKEARPDLATNKNSST